MTARRFRSQVNLFAAQSGLCVARVLLALSPVPEFRGRLRYRIVNATERNVLSRKRRRGTLIGNLSKKGKVPKSTPEEQQHEAIHPGGIFHQIDRLESPGDHGQQDAAPRSEEDEEDEEDEEEDDNADEPPVVREPDED